MDNSPVPDQDASSVQQPSDGTISGTCRNDVHLKLLIPNAAVGAVVGRGGESVSQLQQQTGTRIKMSRPNEFYPGTVDRVCLISGPAESVAQSYHLIIRKICDRPSEMNNLSSTASESESGSPASRRTNGERTKQVKLLVTNSTAGMVIGKGGSNIKVIKEESGAQIQISQKATPSNPNGPQSGSHAERLITISGDLEELDRAVRLILHKIESDPQSAACATISYADANANLSPAPGRSQPPHSSNQSPFDSLVSPRFASRREANGASHERAQLDGRPRNSNNSGNNSNNVGHAAYMHAEQDNASRVSANLDQLAALMRSSGINEQAVAEITAAMSTLITYGLLNVNLDASSVGGSLQYSLFGGLQLQPANGVQSLAAYPQNPFTQNFPQTAYSSAGLMQAGASGAAVTQGNATSSYLAPNTPTPSYLNANAPAQSNNDDALSLSSASFSVPVQSGQLVDVDPNGSAPPAFTAVYDGSTIVPINVFEMLNQAGLPQLGGLQPGTVNLHALNQAGLLPAMPLANMQQMNMADAAMQQRYVDDGMNGGQVQRELKVHESLIGVIFGVGGKWITELQSQTGASIQVSKKGVYAQASHDRIVTLKGSLPSVSHAANLIMQKLSSEEERRASRRQPGRGDAQSTDSDYATTA